MKKLFTFAVVAALALPGVACRKQVNLKTQVKSFLDNTERLPRTLTYVANETSLKVKYRVTGQIEDSFRFRALMDVDGKPTVEAIVDDDALAVRLLDTSILGSAGTGALPVSQVVSGAIAGGQWVSDPSGAPSRARRQTQRTGNGLQDAIDVLIYTRAAIDESVEVKHWLEEDLEPAYLATEDHFPQPDIKAGEDRYDLVRPQIPRPTRTAQAGVQELPKISMFRKMAIFVRGGRVVRIMEDVDLDGHADFVDAKKKKKKRMLELLATIQRLKGADAIRERTMTVTFTDLGKEVEVRQPPEALKVPLRGLLAQGLASFGSPEAQTQNPIGPEGPEGEATPSPTSGEQPPAAPGGETSPAPPA